MMAPALLLVVVLAVPAMVVSVLLRPRLLPVVKGRARARVKAATDGCSRQLAPQVILGRCRYHGEIQHQPPPPGIAEHCPT